jgi:hypothetical protein
MALGLAQAPAAIVEECLGTLLSTLEVAEYQNDFILASGSIQPEMGSLELITRHFGLEVVDH